MSGSSNNIGANSAGGEAGANAGLAAQIPKLVASVNGPDWAKTPAGFQQWIAENRGLALQQATIILAVLAWIAVLLRLAARHFARAGLWWDDFSMVIATLMATPLIVLGTLGPAQNLGRHLPYIIMTGQFYGKTQYITLLLLYLTLAVTKISILLMYSRIFPVARLWNRRNGANKQMGGYSICWWITLFCVIGYGVSFTFVYSCGCQPLDYWKYFPYPTDMKCINVSGQYFSFAIDIALDLAILSLPVAKIIKLKLPLVQRLMLCGVFLVGAFSTMTAIIRLIYVINLSGTKDPSFDGVDSILWSVIEVFSGIICGCLPVMRPLYLAAKRRTPFGTPKSSEKSSPASTNLGSQSSDGNYEKANALEKGTWQPCFGISKRQDINVESEGVTESRGNVSRGNISAPLGPDRKPVSDYTGAQRTNVGARLSRDTPPVAPNPRVVDAADKPRHMPVEIYRNASPAGVQLPHHTLEQVGRSHTPGYYADRVAGTGGYEHRRERSGGNQRLVSTREGMENAAAKRHGGVSL